MSFLGFCPALHVLLGSRVDVTSCGGGALCTIVPAYGAACPTVVDGRLQVLVVGPGGQNGAGWWHKGWCGGAVAGAGAGAGARYAVVAAASSSTAALAGSLRLQGSNELGVHGDEFCREPFDRSRELGDGGPIAGRGCRQVRNGVHRLLL